jgi:hypothetical protein
MDSIHAKGYLGQRDHEGYYERYYPLVNLDIYRGSTSFRDDDFFRNYFNPYILPQEDAVSTYLKDELTTGFTCPNESISKNLDEIRYAYRLITLSYLLEGQWHLNALSQQFAFKNGCHFDLQTWIKKCHPKYPEMKKFISRIKSFNPRYQESFPVNYRAADWITELKSRNYKWYSHYRLAEKCPKCTEKTLASALKQSCEENEELMDKICQEVDEAYGLSTERDAYFLLSQSNIINTFNQNGEAQGCLRRFSEVFAHKESRYPELKNLFPPLLDFLKSRHGERFLQGRAFFFGAGKEYDEKGLADFYVKDQPLVVDVIKKEGPKIIAKVEPKPEPKHEPPKVVEAPKPEPIVEIKNPVKSAFLQAAEIRAQQNLDSSEVDMLKLKYDYVFSLHMINTLSEKLKTFMGRDALKEMVAFDKLGSKEGPVPLLFIKFMIDMQEHQGLWNLVTVVGSRFYVSNEIDAFYKPAPEMVELINDDSTNNTWQLKIVRPY